MHVYHFLGTNNIDCNIKFNSEICIAVDKKNRLKLRSCYTTWRTSPIEEIKVYDDIFNNTVNIYTYNSIYSIACDSIEEAYRLAEAIRDHLV